MRRFKFSKISINFHFTYIAVVFPEKVKVHQLPKGLSKDRLLGYLGKKLGSQVEIHMQGTSQEWDYAWVNCTDRETASLVVEKLNGRQVEIQQGHSRIKHTIHAQPNRKGMYMQYVEYICRVFHNLHWN